MLWLASLSLFFFFPTPHQAELTEHCRLYLNDAPSERRDLEAKVKEMSAIVAKSKNALYDCGTQQAEFWKGCLDDLPQVKVDMSESVRVDRSELRANL